MVTTVAKHRAAGASRASPSRGRGLCLQMLQTLFIPVNPWGMHVHVFFFFLGRALWFPCSPRQQCWRKTIQISSPSPFALSGSQVKKDLFMTVLIFSVIFYWAPVLSRDRELVSLLFLVWSDKLVPLPWDWTMDKNQFSFKKLQQFAFSFCCCLYWFPELSETLSILLQSSFIWKGTVMMATVAEKSVFCLLLALPRAKPSRFIPSVVVRRDSGGDYSLVPWF